MLVSSWNSSWSWNPILNLPCLPIKSALRFLFTMMMCWGTREFIFGWKLQNNFPQQANLDFVPSRQVLLHGRVDGGIFTGLLLQFTNYFPNPRANLHSASVVQTINSRTFDEPLCLYFKKFQDHVVIILSWTFGFCKIIVKTLFSLILNEINTPPTPALVYFHRLSRMMLLRMEGCLWFATSRLSRFPSFCFMF